MVQHLRVGLLTSWDRTKGTIRGVTGQIPPAAETRTRREKRLAGALLASFVALRCTSPRRNRPPGGLQPPRRHRRRYCRLRIGHSCCHRPRCCRLTFGHFCCHRRLYCRLLSGHSCCCRVRGLKFMDVDAAPSAVYRETAMLEFPFTVSKVCHVPILFFFGGGLWAFISTSGSV